MEWTFQCSSRWKYYWLRYSWNSSTFTKKQKIFTKTRRRWSWLWLGRTAWNGWLVLFIYLFAGYTDRLTVL